MSHLIAELHMVSTPDNRYGILWKRADGDHLWKETFETMEEAEKKMDELLAEFKQVLVDAGVSEELLKQEHERVLPH